LESGESANQNKGQEAESLVIETDNIILRPFTDQKSRQVAQSPGHPGLRKITSRGIPE
jgi:hypothetical protein